MPVTIIIPVYYNIIALRLSDTGRHSTNFRFVSFVSYSDHFWKHIKHVSHSTEYCTGESRIKFDIRLDWIIELLNYICIQSHREWRRKTTILAVLINDDQRTLWLFANQNIKLYAIDHFSLCNRTKTNIHIIYVYWTVKYDRPQSCITKSKCSGPR